MPVTSMRLTDVFANDLVVIGLNERSKRGVVAELVRRAVESGRIDPSNEEPLVQMIIAREALGSTDLGNGIAMPHCRTNVTKTFIGVVAIDRGGVEFGAIDRRTVQIVFLLLGPLDRREQHFDILGRISALSRDKTIRTQLCGCRLSTEVSEILDEIDGS
jgi:mannitol/fructose-specific phosphotransferase system IIA component (Ntr-type)